MAALHRVELKGDRPVPVDPEPLQRALDLLGRLGDLAADVRVLDPQQALAPAPAREEPVEEKGAYSADVQEAGRTRGHADADAHVASVVALRRRIAHKDGTKRMLVFETRITPVASQRAFGVPRAAASGPATAVPSGVSTKEPSASWTRLATGRAPVSHSGGS
jgi:hypothetical protein